MEGLLPHHPQIVLILDIDFAWGLAPKLFLVIQVRAECINRELNNATAKVHLCPQIEYSLFCDLTKINELWYFNNWR